MHGTDSFYCEKLSATLQLKTCIQRHTSGNFMVCKNCQLGAAHSGRKPVRANLTHFCVRCQRQATRLIGKQLCISCYNRQREFERGKNRHGNPPTLLVADRRIAVTAHDRLVLHHHKVTSMTELLVGLAKRGNFDQASLPFSLNPGVPFQYDLFA